MTVKVAGGKAEDGVVIGNTYDKYGTSNPIARRLVEGFDDALSGLVRKIDPSSIHEVGCGEGYWTLRWMSANIDARGTDFSSEVIEMAKANALAEGADAASFEVRSIYEMLPGRDSAPLIVCCEVMEHLEEPEQALEALRGIVDADLIISVPREPIWRVLNLVRGKYISDLGNTPGHLNHWSKAGIVALVERHFEILEVLSPFPWTMLHCRQKV
ncbi:class I SAM-dependent methyltransferase [Devosia sp. SL43]|uniref:class I SAM-dependent methyltransferase n=1 Tax=Devosia sp. SL43 TaxID=2806348 RepID=UPI001F1E05B1|nr:class I SAM-dependent methyltransferase [Devosia sp. SL43]UJW85872.1 class I SAM-dependent methyltransferase [Devosia sp. SL43]